MSFLALCRLIKTVMAMSSRCRRESGFYRALNNRSTADYYDCDEPPTKTKCLQLNYSEGDELPGDVFAVSRLVRFRVVKVNFLTDHDL